MTKKNRKLGIVDKIISGLKKNAISVFFILNTIIFFYPREKIS